jgi:hypothetical protein
VLLKPTLGALVLLLLGSLPARAAEIDLSPYLAVVPQVGDFRRYATNPYFGWPDRIETAVAVEAVKGGSLITYEIGYERSTTTRVREFVVAGRTLWVDHLGSLSLKRLKAWAPLWTALPRRLPALTVFASNARVRSKSTLMRLEPLETPGFSYPEVLRVEDDQVFVYDWVRPRRRVSRSIRWYTAGVGLVASSGPDSEQPAEWLVSAQINGVASP